MKFYSPNRFVVAASLVSALVALPSAQIQSSGPLSGNSVEADYDLTDLSLEELMGIEVTVASRTGQKISDSPAAVYVLTGDEIRRSGHSSVPEALRMVPGLYVSHWTNESWDVTARGFGTGLSGTNFAYLNQLLVMIDGVVVYTPLFAGMWWALQDIDMGSIDRIEIVRGPGGIMWGSNTVNGIIHIITKDAGDTQGFKAYGRVGLDDNHTSVRYGTPIGESGFVRVWGKVGTYDTPKNRFAGFESNWAVNSVGFRADWVDSNAKEQTLWGRFYDGRFRNIGFDLVTFNPFSSIANKEGGQLSWSMVNPENGERWSAWFTRDRQDIPTLLDIAIDTIDLEYQRQNDLTENSRLTWGVGVRHISSDLTGDDPFFLDFTPHQRRQTNPRAFAVDTIRFPDINAELVLGLQVEDNELSDLELQPSVRGSWRPSEDVMLWGAVSRAVRTPSLEEVSLSDQSLLRGNPDFDSEKLTAYELGARWAISERAVADLALFYNDQKDLHYNFGNYFTGIPLSNDAEAKSYGLELAVDLKPSERWNLRCSYSYVDQEAEDSVTGATIGVDKYSPEHLFNVRSYYDVTDELEFDVALYVVSGLKNRFRKAEYSRIDARLGYHPSPSYEWSLGIQNANDPTHSELDEFDLIRRSVYVSLTWTPGHKAE